MKRNVIRFWICLVIFWIVGETPAFPHEENVLKAKASILKMGIYQSPAIRSGPTVERGPWITLEVKNSGKRDLYIDKRALSRGMKIIIVDSSGKPATLNARGTSRASKVLPEGGNSQSWTLSFVSPYTDEFPLSDFADLEFNVEYTVRFEWEVEIYERQFGKYDRPSPVERVLLKSKPLKATRQRAE